MIGVLRQCRRCGLWRSIERFGEHATLCRSCMNIKQSTTKRIALTRGYALTDKARAALRELEAA